MGYDISVVIGTFGDREIWTPLANRAHLSVLKQHPKPKEIIRSHEESLAQARNEGARKASGEWLVFLDADDELEPGYLTAMIKSQGDLRYPRVRYVTQDSINKEFIIPEPIVLGKRNLLTAGNYMVIGTMLKRDRFWAAGGFAELPAYEDWDLWIRCWLQGAQDQLVPGAVYRAYKHTHGRNYVRDAPKLFKEIASKYRREAIRKGLMRCERR